MVLVLVFLPLLALAADTPPSPQAPDLKTFDQKISYVLGREIGNSLSASPSQIDIDLFMRGLKDVMDKRPSPISEEEEDQVKAQFSAQMKEEQSKRWAEQAEKNRKEEEDFLAKNKAQKGVLSTESGLQYQVLRAGKGPKPKEADKVKVNYRGTLLDGTEFDSSYARNQPAVFSVGGVIPGWTEGLQLMDVGGKYRLWIPSRLAYGNRGAGRQIGPNAMLIFEVEPLEIVK
jgi:FKBP-type peptidyl-prolyl cis-trans isomerase